MLSFTVHAQESLINVGLRGFNAFICVVSANSSDNAEARSHVERLFNLGLSSSRQFHDRVMLAQTNPSSVDGQVKKDQVPMGLLEALEGSNGLRDFYAGRLFQIANEYIISSGYKAYPYGSTENRTLEQVDDSRRHWFLLKFKENNCSILR